MLSAPWLRPTAHGETSIHAVVDYSGMYVCMLVSGGPSSESGLSGISSGRSNREGGRFERLAQGFAVFWCMVRVVWEARVGD